MIVTLYIKIKQELFTKLINLVSIITFVHSVNSQGVMNKMGKVGGVLFFLRTNEKKNGTSYVHVDHERGRLIE